MGETEDRVLPFGAALRYLRIERGLKQSEVADAIGIKQSSYSDWERSMEPPKNLFALAELAAFLHVSFDELQAGIVKVPKGAEIPSHGRLATGADPFAEMITRLAPNTTPRNLRRLIRLYDGITPHQQDSVLRLIEAFHEAPEGPTGPPAPGNIEKTETSILETN